MSDDSPRAFLDTNILAYAVLSDDPIRSPKARKLIRELTSTGSPVTSTQVLQELYVTLIRKTARPLTPAQAQRYLDRIARWPVFSPDYRAIREAVDVSAANQISFWDALIVVAAVRLRARILYTEDLNHGQKILGVEVVNPFRLP